MTEAAHILALFSMLFLVVSVAIWAGLLGGPLLQRLDGRKESNAGPAKVGLQALVLAFVSSTVAAVLAIIGWIAP